MSELSVSEFYAALDAWRLRVAEWLGLDPVKVFALDDGRGDHGLLALEWSALEPAEPVERRWAERVLSVRDDGDGPVLTTRVTLHPDDEVALVAAAGSKPRLLTREQELMLRGLATEDRA